MFQPGAANCDVKTHPDEFSSIGDADSISTPEPEFDSCTMYGKKSRFRQFRVIAVFTHFSFLLAAQIKKAAMMVSSPDNSSAV